MAEGDVAPGPPPAAAREELPTLVGRLRKWHPGGEWGFVFSELHQCDAFLEAEGASGELSQGDLVLFEAFDDEDGQLSARGCRRAEPWEVEQRLQALEPYFGRYSARASLHGQQVTELTSAPLGAPGTPVGVGLEQHRCAGMHLAGGAPQLPMAHPSAEGMLLPPAGAAPSVMHSQPGPLPPPPPAHPAPTGPAGFPAQQAFEAGFAASFKQGYPQPYQAYGLDGRAAQQPQQYWQQGSGAAAQLATAEPRSEDVILLAPPVLLAAEPRAAASTLRGGDPVIRRAQTMATRCGTLAQVGQSWCSAVRLARQMGSMLGEDVGAQDHQDHRLRGQQQAHAPLQQQQQQQQQQYWKWSDPGAADVGGPMRGAGAGYGSAGPMGQQGHMLGMTGMGGEHSMYQAAQAG